MRTTLDIDADLLAATKEMARREHTSAGRIVSRLLRQALTQPKATKIDAEVHDPTGFYGFEPFASRGDVVTDALVERLRDEEGI